MLALTLLNDDNGISEEASNLLIDALEATDNDDLVDHIKVTQRRYYIPSDFAEDQMEILRRDHIETNWTDNLTN
jgi:hypothetical protein